MDLNDLFEPEILTQPTQEEYDDALTRIWVALGPQGIRDMHTAFWSGWNQGFTQGRAQRS